MTARNIAYWISTGVLAFVWLTGGVAELIGWHGTVDGVIRLGYPAYFVTLLGFWKVAAAIAITMPGARRLKEWAYAGTIFELTGAVVSQSVAHDSMRHIVVPTLFAVVAVISWALRPPGRVLGELPTTLMRA